MSTSHLFVHDIQEIREREPVLLESGIWRKEIEYVSRTGSLIVTAYSRNKPGLGVIEEHRTESAA